MWEFWCNHQLWQWRTNSKSCIFWVAISHKIMQMGTYMYILLYTNCKSSVGFLMAQSTLTFSDLERSNSRSCIFWVAISSKILQISIYLLLFSNRKSYVGYLMALLTSTFSDLERLNSRPCIFWVAISHKILQIGIIY